MAGHCVLYGAYASYYTARVRAALRKKGVPFVERLPSHARFRDHVRPSSGSHRIPQLELPDGSVVQDSTAIIDTLEALWPQVPILPPTPRQRLVAHLVELLGTEGLLPMAFRYRWAAQDNLHFVTMDFGRSFRPQGSDEELLHYGGVIAERMLSRGDVETGPEAVAALEAEYGELLDLLEAHFTGHPWLLGGHPSAADYALMGALHAHMGRDPVPLGVQQRRAPRVFRWVEHMLVPEVQAPEFAEVPVAWAADDVLPETTLALLRHLVQRYLPRFLVNAGAWNQAVAELQPAPGDPVPGEPQQPVLDPVQVDGRQVRPVAHHVWLLQRALAHLQAQDGAAQQACRELLAACGAQVLVDLQVQQPPRREDNRFLFG